MGIVAFSGTKVFENVARSVIEMAEHEILCPTVRLGEAQDQLTFQD